MKLIFDCTSLSNWKGHATGIQRVVIETGRELCRILPRANLGLFDDEGRCLRYDLDTRKVSEEIPLLPGDIVVTAGSNWDYPEHHLRMMRIKNSGLLVGTLFHDIIPMLLPHSYGPGFSDVYAAWFREALSASDVAFSNSEHTKQDIIRYANQNDITCPSVFCIRLGDEVPESSETPSEEIIERTSNRYILSVGTLEYRKNHMILLNAYRYMIDVQAYEPPVLYIVGKKGWLDHDIEYQIDNDPRLTGRIVVLSGVSDADLSLLYQNSMFTVYPSFYEGWGLPVAESLCFGKPCIASGVSSMLEIAPGLVRHAHPLIVNEWVDSIRALADDLEELQKASDLIRCGYVRWSWESTAKAMRDALIGQYPSLLSS